MDLDYDEDFKVKDDLNMNYLCEWKS